MNARLSSMLSRTRQLDRPCSFTWRSALLTGCLVLSSLAGRGVCQTTFVEPANASTTAAPMAPTVKGRGVVRWLSSDTGRKTQASGDTSLNERTGVQTIEQRGNVHLGEPLRAPLPSPVQRTSFDPSVDATLVIDEAHCPDNSSIANCGPTIDESCPVTVPNLRLADEYLCDGGDRMSRVVVNRNWRVTGLDLEDTIGHYDTLDGRTLVTPSNNVCIYAPRFAATRKIVQTWQDETLLAMQEVNQPLPSLTDNLTNGPKRFDLPVPPVNEIGLRAPLGQTHRVRGLDLLHALPVAELAKDFRAHEDFQVVHVGIHRTSERVQVAEYAAAAVIWTENVAPEVILGVEPAAVDTTIEKPATIHHLGLEGRPKLRVLKLASHGSAKPGEEVMFTLRFDNVGEQTIGNVTIMDNLTTRLEYVPDSAECDLKAEFFSELNQGESLVLRWEIQEPIRPGEGGIIRFRCRVR